MNTRNILTIGVSLFIGFLLGMAVLPFLKSLGELKDVWGAVVGGFIGVIAALCVLLLQKRIEKNEKELGDRELKLRLAVQVFFIFKQKIKELKELPNNILPYTPFEVSGMERVREKAFDLLGVEYGQVSEVIYADFLELNHPIREGAELRSIQVGAGGNQPWDVRRGDLLTQYNFYKGRILESEDILGALEKKLEKQHQVKLKTDGIIKIGSK